MVRSKKKVGSILPVQLMSRVSLSEWQFVEWLRGNKEAAKLVISALFGLWVPADPQLKVLAGALAKLVLDTIDYAFKEK